MDPNCGSLFDCLGRVLLHTIKTLMSSLRYLKILFCPLLPLKPLARPLVTIELSSVLLKNSWCPAHIGGTETPGDKILANRGPRLEVT
jgi:hypothetical protein